MIDNIEGTKAAGWVVAALLSEGTLLCISVALWLREKGLWGDSVGIGRLRSLRLSLCMSSGHYDLRQ